MHVANIFENLKYHMQQTHAVFGELDHYGSESFYIIDNVTFSAKSRIHQHP